MRGRFSLCYWGPISYYAALISYPQIRLEQFDNFIKQSYRNRAYIDGPNGELMLNLSIDHNSRSIMRDTRISSKENWRQKHWQALQTSYGNSPFFDTLAPELERFYQMEQSDLASLNFQTTRLALKWLRFEGEISLSNSWELEEGEESRRDDFSPKRRNRFQTAYPQVFDHKTGFKSDLSILDLLFNEGPASWDYLQHL